MRYSELAGKEIICIDEGIRLGAIDHTDLIIDLRTGEVQSIIIPYGSRWFRPETDCGLGGASRKSGVT